MNYIVYLLLPLFFANYNASKVSNVNQSSAQDSVVRVFTLKNSSFRSSVHSKSIKDFTLMQLDTQAFQSMRGKNLQRMDFSLPFRKNNIEIELEAVQIFDQSFKVMTNRSNGKAVEYVPGKYYIGKIAGDPKSVVTLSVYEDEINGIISSEEFGNLNLGKSNALDPGEYILYGQDEAKEQILFDCRTPEGALNPPDLKELQPQIDKQLESRAAGCVAVDFELTYEVYTNFQNNVTSATNWITALFTGVKALYLAEGIDINIKSVYVWTSEDGYSDDVSTALTLLGTRRVSDPAFTGNLVHLVRGKSCSGGCSLAGIAWLNVLCKPNNRFGVSEPIFTYAAYPAYSWSVNVLTHEIGHNFGSNHTHWCGWTGGAIDNCLAVEGTCSPGPSPGEGGGTIMSYCHNVPSIGIKFANGFGPQPGAAIRARYNAVTCLSTSCGTVILPTCTDGIKNGTETGIDCGGSCSPCVAPPTCTDGIQNGTETGVDCGGTCTACSQVCPSTLNLSQGKPATQSTTYSSTYPASKANDGASTFNHTNAELQPWWQVDLGSTNLVTSIQLTNRQDCCGNRIKRFRVFVSNSPIASYATAGYAYVFDNASGLTNGQVININNLTATGRYVRVWVDNTGYGNDYLHLSEVKVMGCVSTVNPCTGNVSPTVTIATSSTAFPQGSPTYPRGSSFNINATVNDSDGSVNSVEFYNGSTLLGTDNSSPFSFTISSATSNSYSLTAKAIDNCNAATTSSQLSVSTTVSCSDGYQNGNETGIDCGGNCTACSQACASPILLSQGKTASQSSTYSSSYLASKAVDGIKSTTNFNHTNSELYCLFTTPFIFCQL